MSIDFDLTRISLAGQPSASVGGNARRKGVTAAEVAATTSGCCGSSLGWCRFRITLALTAQTTTKAINIAWQHVGNLNIVFWFEKTNSSPL